VRIRNKPYERKHKIFSEKNFCLIKYLLMEDISPEKGNLEAEVVVSENRPSRYNISKP